MRRAPNTAWIAALAVLLSPAYAQSPPASAPTTPAPPCEAPCLRAGSIVDLELVEPMSSLRHQRGDRFSLRTSEALTIDGKTVVPAGTEVVGAVVHANKSRSGGQPGELILAARSMQVGPVSVPLKGMKLGRSGRDKSTDALVASIVIGPLAMFMRGQEIEIPASTRAHAKVAADVSLAPPASDTAAPTP